MYQGFDRTGRDLLMVFHTVASRGCDRLEGRIVAGAIVEAQFSRFSHLFGTDRLPSCPTSL